MMDHHTTPPTGENTTDSNDSATNIVSFQDAWLKKQKQRVNGQKMTTTPAGFAPEDVATTGRVEPTSKPTGDANNDTAAASADAHASDTAWFIERDPSAKHHTGLDSQLMRSPQGLQALRIFARISALSQGHRFTPVYISQAFFDGSSLD